MKINKKTIIIVIVVAVAAFLIWRKRKGSAGGSSETEPVPGSGTGTTSLDYILSHINFNGTERNKIESMRQACENSKIQRQSIEAKAYQNGLSFDQQLVCDAIWNLYTKNGQWTNDRGWKLNSQVKKL